MRIIILISVLIFAYSCGGTQTKVVSTGTENLGTRSDVTASSDPMVKAKETINYEPGVINLRSIGIGGNSKEAAKEAERNAMKAVLFSGVPGSNLEKPLIGLEGKEKHKMYFNTFLKTDGAYKDFVMSTKLLPAERVKMKKGMRIGIDIKINYALLQEKLEKDGLKDSFGISVKN